MSGATTSGDDDDDDIVSIVSEQRRELAMAEALESDFDLAFRLQLQEALTASLAFQPSSPAAAADAAGSSHPPPAATGGEAITFASLQSQELRKFEQERRDREQRDAEMKKIRANLDRSLHDHKFATDVDRFPEDQWKEYGDELERPYGEGPSESSKPFKLYFKGLVSQESVGDSRVVLAAIGVAICDPRDNLVFELRKPLLGNGQNRQGAELMALIEGLNAALRLDLKRVTFFCDYFPLYQFVIAKWPPKQRKIEALVHQVYLLRRKFAYCNPALVPRKDIRFAFKLARDSVLSQVTNCAESNSCKDAVENCVICLEDTAVGEMFTIDGCQHKYCFSCMKQHVEVKLLHAIVPICPHEGCKSELKVESCQKFLSPKFIEMMKQQIKEAAIPVTEKVYCPYPKCSALMSRSEVTKYARGAFVGSDRTGARKCTICHGLFCINCQVPWHSNMSCYDYKHLNPFPRAEDAKLKSLATTNLWRQCKKCNHMIELAEGCYHMTCRCGHEFCYICGAEWKNKQATCGCRLWDEHNIIHDDEEDEDDDAELDFDDEDADFYDTEPEMEDYYW